MPSSFVLILSFLASLVIIQVHTLPVPHGLVARTGLVLDPVKRTASHSQQPGSSRPPTHPNRPPAVPPVDLGGSSTNNGPGTAPHITTSPSSPPSSQPANQASSSSHLSVSPPPSSPPSQPANQASSSSSNRPANQASSSVHLSVPPPSSPPSGPANRASSSSPQSLGSQASSSSGGSIFTAKTPGTLTPQSSIHGGQQGPPVLPNIPAFDPIIIPQLQQPPTP